MSTLEALLLGVIQGLTEFLPVSSSGHLVLGRHFLGLTQSSLAFDVVVHVATLMATLFYYRVTLKQMLVESLVFARGGEYSLSVVRNNESLWLLLLVVVASVPTGIIGLGAKDLIEPLFTSPKFSAAMLIFTGIVLLTTLKDRSTEVGLLAFGLAPALLIGVVQGFAVLPGISRSGTTIACALLLGLNRDSAARFSFLLAVPAIFGALLLELGELSALSAEAMLPVGAGFLSALVSGFFALVLLVRLIQRGRFYLFSFYLLPVGLFGVLWLP